MVSLPGGEHCRCTNEGSAPRGWHLDQRWQKRGGGKQSILLLPLVRWAGPPWIQPVEQCCSLKLANGLCPQTVFECPQVSDVGARCIIWMVSTSAFVAFCSSRRRLHIIRKLSASCMQWTACGLVRSASQRALLARSSLRLAVAGPVHGVKTHVPCNRNARGMSQSEYAVPLIHSMRPSNRQETHGVCESRDPQFRRLRAVCDRANKENESPQPLAKRGWESPRSP